MIHNVSNATLDVCKHRRMRQWCNKYKILNILYDFMYFTSIENIKIVHTWEFYNIFIGLMCYIYTYQQPVVLNLDAE